MACDTKSASDWALATPTTSCSSSVTPKTMAPPFVLAKALTLLSQLLGLARSTASLKSQSVVSAMSCSINPVSNLFWNIVAVLRAYMNLNTAWNSHLAKRRHAFGILLSIHALSSFSFSEHRAQLLDCEHESGRRLRLLHCVVDDS